MDASGILSTGDRTQAICKYKPQDVQGLHRFLCVINSYRRSIPKAAQIQSHLQVLIKITKKRDYTPIEWTEDTI